MKKIDLNSMSINELWSLHEETTTVLSSRMLAQKLKLEQWLVKLGALDDPDIHPSFEIPSRPIKLGPGAAGSRNGSANYLLTGNLKTICGLRNESPILIRGRRRMGFGRKTRAATSGAWAD
jgi:hypothetical protein